VVLVEIGKTEVGVEEGDVGVTIALVGGSSEEELIILVDLAQSDVLSRSHEVLRVSCQVHVVGHDDLDLKRE